VYEGDLYENPETRKTSSWPRFLGVHAAAAAARRRPGRLLRVCDDGILTVQINDPYGGQKKRFAIQQSGQDQMNASQIMQMKRINEDLPQTRLRAEMSQEYRDALEVLKKTSRTCAAAWRIRPTAASWRTCAGRCARRWARATKNAWRRQLRPQDRS